MNTFWKPIFTAMAAIMILGIVGCSTTKHEPAPAAPAPVAKPEPAPVFTPPPEPEPAPAPKPDRG